MARLEIQIAADLLIEAVQRSFARRLYAQCLISPLPGLVLDRLVLSAIGQAKPSQGSLGIQVSVGVSLVKQQAVIDANGGPPALPNPFPQVTANIVVSIAGTQMRISFDKVNRDASYQALLNLATLALGSAQDAQAMFDAWESQIKTDLDSDPLLLCDLKDGMPPELRLQFGRSALSADQVRIAARLEVGQMNSDGNWSTFLTGNMDDLLRGNKWGLFASADVIVHIADSNINQLISTIGGLLAQSGPSAWDPSNSVAKIRSALSASTHIHTTFLGITVDDEDVKVPIDLTTEFTMEANVTQIPMMRTDISYSIRQAQGGVAADLMNFLGTVEASITQSVTNIPGYTKVGDREFFRDTSLQPQMLTDPSTGIQELTLRATSVTALPTGMLIAGTAVSGAAVNAPSCDVATSPFALQFITSCSSIKEHGRQAATTQNTAAAASFTVSEPTDELPLIVGGLTPVSVDAQGQFGPFLPSSFPQQIDSPTTFDVRVPGQAINPVYEAHPYPCDFILLSNGGARYVSLGEIPNPILDRNGVVQNATTVYIPDCHDVDIDPWVIMVGVFNPKWLVDPPSGDPGGEQEGERIVAAALARVLRTIQPGGVSPVFIQATQVGTISLGSLIAGIDSTNETGALERAASVLATTLLERAARLQPPSIRTGSQVKAPSQGRQ